MSAQRVKTAARLCSSLVLTMAAVTSCASSAPSGGRSASMRPNIVLLVADDQRWDSLDSMPWLESQADWANVPNTFVNDPQCCPSRATILTGRYAHHTGVETLLDGPKLDERATLATMLHDAGYTTGLFGKYLNGYPFGRGHYVPPGWDTWSAYEGATNYGDYHLNEDGILVAYGEDPASYSTDVLAAKARAFIAAAPSGQPFFVYLPFNAPHYVGKGFAVPAAQDAGVCAGKPPVHTPSFNAVDTIAPPAWLRDVGPVRVEPEDEKQRVTCETLLSVDRAVRSIIDELTKSGRLDNTYLLYTSDNGYAFGEHRFEGKGDLYDESIRVPLRVKGPGVRAGTVARLTSNADLTPTILDWAGVTSPEGFVDGESFAANLRGEQGTRPTEVLLRGCRTKGASGDEEHATCGGYGTGFGMNWGLRTATHAYVEYEDGSTQLFDLRADPYELANISGDPAQADLIAQLHARLDALRGF